MNKIEETLKKQIQSQPKKEYKIIVTGSLENDEAKKLGLNPIKGLDNIYSGSVQGAEILKTENNKNVESIELDGDVEILD